MLSVLGVVGILFAYVVIGAIAGVVTHKISKDNDLAAGVGTFWPVGVPVSLFVVAIGAIIYGAIYVVANFKLPSLPKRKTAEQKVLEYSQAPTKVLTEILCAKIIAHPKGLNKYGENWKSADYDPKGKGIYVRFNHYGDAIVSIYTVEVNGKDINLSAVDEKRLCKVLNDTLSLLEKMAKAEKEAADNMKALEAIESLLLAPENL